MPERKTVQRAKRQLRRGRSASSAAGEFVREEMHHIREGKHGARSAKQAIAIGLSKARRAGVPLEPRRGAGTRERTAEKKALAAGKRRAAHRPASKRSRATLAALKREPKRAASHEALARHAKRASAQRGRAARSAAARKAARTRARNEARAR